MERRTILNEPTAPRVERGSKRVRIQLGGEMVADTTRPVLVWETPHYPVYYFPIEDVRADVLAPEADPRRSPKLGEARVFTVAAGGKSVAGAALRYLSSPVEALRDLIRF